MKREGATTLRKKVIDKSIAQKQTELESITQVKPVAEVDSAAVAVTAWQKRAAKIVLDVKTLFEEMPDGANKQEVIKNLESQLRQAKK